ncbi:MAG: hypothetical protein ACYSOF_01535 [Planctomycetota bacterium]|jgi:hypothetical protein
MNTPHGWIKLYRCLLEDAVCQKSAYFHLWVTLLLMAAHKDREFIFNNQIQQLKPGQLITGRKKLSKLTGIPESTVGRILKCLESGHKIEQKILKKYRIISIVKWESYQAQVIGETTGEPMMNQSRTGSEPIVSTYKNDKNEKNDNKHRGDFYLSSEQKKIQRIHDANERAFEQWLEEETKISRV